MKKNIKKAVTGSLLSVCSLLVAAGFGSINSTTAQASGSTFEMIGGASIRIDTNAADTVDERGLRFSSEISVAEFEALDDNGGTVTAGTFIMPYDYIAKNGALNAQTCFGVGGNAVYTWNGKTEVGGTKQILHIAALPYKTASQADANVEVYRINGSVVTMKEENLNRSYVGVSYIAVKEGDTVTYKFAETDTDANQRSALRVAQNILAKSTTSNDTEVAKYYLDTYLEDGVEVTLKNEVYVNSSTGYIERASENVSETKTLTNWEDVVEITATAPSIDGYAYVQALAEEFNLNLSGDATTVVKHYYDEMHDNVIFDGSLASDGVNVLTANGMELGGYAVNQELVKEYEGWGWRGNKSLKISNWAADWTTFNFATPIRFSQPINKISFMVRNSDNKAPVAEAIESNKMTIEFNDGEIADTVSVKSGAGEIYELTYNLRVPQTALWNISIKTDAKHYANNTDAVLYQEHEIYIDYIHAEYDLYLDGVDYFTKVSEANKNTALDVDFSKLNSTVYSDEELASASVKASYKTLPAAPTANGTALTLTDNKASIPVIANKNYEVNYSMTINETEASGKFNVLGYMEYGVLDFETSGITSTLLEKVNKNSCDGSNSLRVAGKENGWATGDFETPITATAATNKFGIWIYSRYDVARTTLCPNNEPGFIWMRGGGYGVNVDQIYQGWNYYEFEIESTTSIKYIEFLTTAKFNGATTYVANVLHIHLDRMSLVPSNV